VNNNNFILSAKLQFRVKIIVPVEFTSTRG